MRSLSAAFFLLSLLFFFAKFGDTRREPAEGYWKKMMKGEAMPKAIEEVLVHGEEQHDDAEISVSKQKKTMMTTTKKKRWDPSSETEINMAHFKMDFDTRPNMIIYHTHNVGV